MMNVVVVRGTLSRPPEVRALSSGSQVVSFEVTVARPGERAESVPVALTDPPAAARALTLTAGDEVIAVGRMRRRFFRAGGAVQSRTELAADQVLSARRRATARRALEEAIAAIGAAAP